MIAARKGTAAGKAGKASLPWWRESNVARMIMGRGGKTRRQTNDSCFHENFTPAPARPTGPTPTA